jgi:hypothetical protein
VRAGLRVDPRYASAANRDHHVITDPISSP